MSTRIRVICRISGVNIILTRNRVTVIKRCAMDYSELYVKRIRELCEKRGFSINKLATMSNVKQSTLDNIVRGLTKNPRAKTLHKLAIAFNMTLAEFLDFKALNDYCFEDNDID